MEKSALGSFHNSDCVNTITSTYSVVLRNVIVVAEPSSYLLSLNLRQSESTAKQTVYHEKLPVTYSAIVMDTDPVTHYRYV